jgi:threonine dehydrogenase-like Zn-dependent dehydrogenase
MLISRRMRHARSQGAPFRGAAHKVSQVAQRAAFLRTMKATYMYAAGDVRIIEVPDPVLVDPTDAIIRITRACVCGSDLHPYADMEPDETGQAMGHEAIGVVEDIGGEVQNLKRGDVVVMPFVSSDGTCDFCREGLTTACDHITFFGRVGEPGAQAEALRVPLADGTLVPLNVGEDDDLMPSLLTLSDVLCTGHHAAVIAKVKPGASVAVIGDGAVGLCGVIAAKRLGAAQIIIIGHHADRTDLARELGATDVVVRNGPEAVEEVHSLAGPRGVHSVLECVGSEAAIETAISIARPGGGVGRVGVPHYAAVPLAFPLWVKNVTVGGGPAPVRAYIETLLPDVLDGAIEPGRVFDRSVDLDGVPDGYRAMAQREALKVMVAP